MRNVFFSFDYKDVWVANVVRNSWVTQETEAAGFWDRSLWEESKKKGDAAIKKLIDDGLEGTSVTVVLVNDRTAERKYVKYEISQSIARGNGILAVYISGIKDSDGNRGRKGRNPLNDHEIDVEGTSKRLFDVCSTYDWEKDDGFHNLGKWVEQAAVEAGRPKTASGDGENLLEFLAKGLLVGLAVVGGAGILAYLFSRLRRNA